MSRSELRVAVVGCGAIAHQHLSFLATMPSVSVIAVCDRSAAAARFCAERYGAGAWYTDVDEMLSKARPDAVHILTPPHTHVVLIERCLEAGCHVLCEKPIAETEAELDRLLALAQASGRVLIESQNYRFNDPVRDVLSLIQAGTIGEVRHIEVSINLDLSAGPLGDPNLVDVQSTLRGGAIHDMLPHMAYLYLLLADWRAPAIVLGRTGNVTGNARVGTDMIEALLEGPDRLRGRLALRPDIKPDAFRIVVGGTRATAETDIFQPYLRVTGGKDVGKRAPLEQFRSGLALSRAGLANLKNKVLQHTPYHGLHRMIGDFYAALASGGAGPISSGEVRASVALVDRLIDISG